VKVRLDRGLANADFLNLFNIVKVWHVQTDGVRSLLFDSRVLTCGTEKKQKKAFVSL